ncbi:MAG TPA: hypothetical protein PKD70_09615 [Saprospiraceae bacterium]|nr:hypothetical protein [Saprospiraceae bacterium]HMP14124.1 hypothetical protein [Saprospiraceae bacterium]
MPTSPQTPVKEPSGNIWGWKFSYISLGIILFFVGLAVVRHWSLGEPFDPARVEPPIPVQQSTPAPPQSDTLK